MRTTRAGWKKCFSCVCLVVLWSLFTPQASATTTPSRKTVLLINEVSLAHPASTLVTERLLSALSSDAAYQVEFYVESIDAPGADESSEARNATRIGDEDRDRHLNPIVGMGPAVIKMITRHDGTFFPGVPIVVCGSSAGQAGNPVLPP